MITNITNLNDYLKIVSNTNCIVKFSKKLSVEFSELAKEYDEVTFLEIDDPNIINHEKITLFPDLLFYSEGKQININYNGDLLNSVTKFIQRIDHYPNIHYLTDLADYQEMIKGNCIIKFTASWCGPCKIAKPTFHELCDKYHSKIVFIEVDVDLAPKISKFAQIKSMPTFMFYFSGELIKMFKGCNLEELLVSTEALMLAVCKLEQLVEISGFSDVSDEELIHEEMIETIEDVDIDDLNDDLRDIDIHDDYDNI
jgi:thioredoxin 1